jgi:hypothetical protein
MIRDLGHVIERENAKAGVFITLAEPTGPMRTEYGKFPKIQILTIAELFEGRQPELPWRDTSGSRRCERRQTGATATVGRFTTPGLSMRGVDSTLS